MASTYINITTHSAKLWDRIAHSYKPGKNEVCIIEPTIKDGQPQGSTAIKIGKDGNTIFGDLPFLTNQQQADWKMEDQSSPAYIKNKPNVDSDILDEAVKGVYIIDYYPMAAAYQRYEKWKEQKNNHYSEDIKQFRSVWFVRLTAGSAYPEEFVYEFPDHYYGYNSTHTITEPYKHGAIYLAQNYNKLEDSHPDWKDHIYGPTPFYCTLDNQEGYPPKPFPQPDELLDVSAGEFYMNENFVCRVNEGIYISIPYLETLLKGPDGTDEMLNDIGRHIEEIKNPYFPQAPAIQVTFPFLAIPYQKVAIKSRYIDMFKPDWEENDPAGLGYIKNRPMHRSPENPHDIWVDPEYLEALQRGTVFLVTINKDGEADRTYEEIEAAYLNGKAIWAVDGEQFYQLVQYDEDGSEGSRETEVPYTFENFLEDKYKNENIKYWELNEQEIKANYLLYREKFSAKEGG